MNAAVKPPHVFAAICGVMEDLAREGISKDRRNQQQGYNFRGIDDVYNALAPFLAKHKLVITPRCLERTCVERQTQKGGALFYVTVDMEFVLTSAEDGSTIVARTFGEAMDSADKATNKAQSAAFKYMAMQQFCIPTEGDNDADATTHEVAAKPSQPLLVAINTMEGYQRDPPAFKEFWSKNREGFKANFDPDEYRQLVEAMQRIAASMPKDETRPEPPRPSPERRPARGHEAAVRELEDDPIPF
jgi:hypothetical protein